MQTQLPAIVKSPIDYYELASFQDCLDFTVYLKSGFKLLLNLEFGQHEAFKPFKAPIFAIHR